MEKNNAVMEKTYLSEKNTRNVTLNLNDVDICGDIFFITARKWKESEMIINSKQRAHKKSSFSNDL